jgi:PAS domain S-box-containing protein
MNPPEASSPFRDPNPTAELEALRRRLQEAEETLRAIHAGEVDAVVVAGTGGERIYTLEGTDWPYRTFVEEMQQGALTLAREGWILYCNRSLSELFGIAEERLLGASFVDLVAPEQRPQWEAMLADPPPRFTLEDVALIRSGGEPVVAHVTGTLLSQGIISLVVTDLTEQRRQAETLARLTALAESSHQVRRVLESITDAYFAIDRDGRFLDLNPRAEEISGQSREQLLGQVLWDALPFLVGSEVERRFRQAMSESQPAHFEHASPESGRWFEIHAYPEEDRIYVYAREISERKHAEERLALLARAGRTLGASLDTRATLRETAALLIPEMADWCAIDVLEDGRLHRIARAHEDPRAEEELLDQATRVALDPESEHPEAVVLRTGRPRLLGDDCGRLLACPAEENDSSPVGLVRDTRSCLIVPITSPSGVLGAIVIGSRWAGRFGEIDVPVVEELARRVGLAIEKARLYAELEQRVLERTGELEETNAQMVAFSYSVAHDLRSPVRAIRGYLDVLLDDVGPEAGEVARSYGRRIAEATERMDRLILDLLAYSRVNQGRLEHEPTSLEEVVREALQAVEFELHERAATIDVALPSGLPPLDAHRSTLVLVITNLIVNAVKFVAPGIPPRVSVRADATSEHVRLLVEDNGLGISPEHLARIFNVFEQLHARSEYPGTGVGLAMVKAAMERMGGRVGVESTPGTGSRFWIELPACVGDSVAPVA